MAAQARSLSLRIGALIAVLALGFGFMISREWGGGEQDIAGSMVTGFERQNELTVFAAQVVTVPTTRIEGVVDMLDKEQTAVIPANVRYTIDLSRMTKEDVRFDTAARKLTITVPPVIVQPPDLREERARYFNKGIVIGSEAHQRLSRSNSIKAGREAVTLASSTEMIALAQDAARLAISNNARVLLSASEQQEATIDVRFAHQGVRGPSQLDRSRPMSDVVKDAGGGR